MELPREDLLILQWHQCFNEHVRLQRRPLNPDKIDVEWFFCVYRIEKWPLVRHGFIKETPWQFIYPPSPPKTRRLAGHILLELEKLDTEDILSRVVIHPRVTAFSCSASRDSRSGLIQKLYEL